MAFFRNQTPDPASDALRQGTLTSSLDWFFLSAGNIFVLVCLACILLPIGSVRLGGRDATPDYSYVGWFSMLFAAGMGIGLMFFGVLEPAYYFGTPWGDQPLARDLGIVEGQLADPATIEAARRTAMAATIFHWGLHPWAVYGIVALGLALFSYQQGAAADRAVALLPDLRRSHLGLAGPYHRHPCRVRDAVRPRHLARLRGPAGQCRPRNTFSGCPTTIDTQVVLIMRITAVALVSVLRGLDGGVKVLSEINMVLAGLLLLFVVVVGATVLILTGFVTNLGAMSSMSCSLSNPFGREGRLLPSGLDLVLLGVVDQLVAVRRHVHRPGQSRPHGARVHRSACC